MPTLPAAGREYLTATLTEAPEATELEVSFDEGDTWHETTRDGDTVTVLVAGPDSEDDPVGTVALPLGRSRVSLRVVDEPEVLIRFAGAIDVG